MKAAVALVLAAGVGLAAPAAAYDTLPRGLAAVTPAEVAERVRVLDAAEQPHVVVSTERAWTRGRGIGGAHAADVHLRALVDRESGAVRWQVWHELVYEGPRRDVAQVAFMAGGREVIAPVSAVEHWEDCPGVDAMMRACNRHVRIAFELPGAVVEEVAAAWLPASREAWRLSFHDADGGAIKGGLAPAEVRGLVDAVGKVRRDAVASAKFASRS